MAKTINIQKGDTLSGLAKQHGTTVEELAKLNNIKNPDLIQAGASLVLPGASAPGTPLVSPSPSAKIAQLSGGARTVVPEFPQVRTLEEANNFINAGQQADYQSREGATAPPVRTSLADRLNEARTALSPETTPTPTSLADTYKNLRTDKGQTGRSVDDLEAELNAINAEIDAEDARARKYAGDVRTEAISSGAMSGRISDDERAQRENVDFLNRRKTAIANELTTKYKMIETVMNLTEKDYANASADYSKRFTENIQLLNAIQGIDNAQKTEEGRLRDDARANLQIIANQLASGDLVADNLSPDQKTFISKLELQAGLPMGTITAIKDRNPKADIVSTTSRNAPDGYEYTDLVLRDKDTGELKVQSIRLGAARAPQGDSDRATEESTIISLYRDVLESAITEGATPSEAVFAAMAVADNTTGSKIGVNGQGALLKEAERLFKTKDALNAAKNADVAPPLRPTPFVDALDSYLFSNKGSTTAVAKK